MLNVSFIQHLEPPEKKSMDLVFTVSSTGSSSVIFNQQKNYINNILDNYVISPNYVQTGLITSGNNVNTDVNINADVNLRDRLNVNNIKRILSTLEYKEGAGSDVVNIIEAGKTMIREQGTRKGAYKLIVLLLSRISKANIINLYDVITGLKNEDIELKLVGFGDGANMETLKKIEPTPSRINWIDIFSKTEIMQTGFSGGS